MPGQWADSKRNTQLPDDWPQRKHEVWVRDQGLCQWPMELDPRIIHPIESFQRDVERCGADGRDVDHIEHGSSHELEKLQLLCGWHHDRKSSAEGNAARIRVSVKRPKARHPGLLR